MNIVITLPIELIAEIANGHKKTEIRKFLPKNFNTISDVVYVVQKGTRKVPMFLTIAGFDTMTPEDDVWGLYGKYIRVPFAWLYRYSLGAKQIVAWNIDEVHMLHDPNDIYPNLGITCNPQSYVYTSCPADLFQETTWWQFGRWKKAVQ